ncbi:hypothetical protein GLOIN_2v1645132 [Rhizophagus irregularis DAOM 181602=DAOM 197198]|uniref:Uncharacterized protein n=1 Tax=Rhizophagus irregularis (strain DAOM 181602 / DAOM 197198 / MUCL 43194) TaxID=747089 RepID=A0A2P4PQL4_RHIID|nr:hypothetical protein GLOIN_2v1645132 [Rhizophagus irregularis DAOM 181602=DAOM 197198]POG67652.1 hypothetical protein GLOIN_2v1645132 [Rhizophagus irregularis DAOM 181602=DAOM 197198]|eukprot:XP_025174518.1 hypothetical protein GLOIN_2v1645132 [Rhizophagus irregularis DAOM 181602=DAOM 197198]
MWHNIITNILLVSILYLGHFHSHSLVIYLNTICGLMEKIKNFTNIITRNMVTYARFSLMNGL